VLVAVLYLVLRTPQVVVVEQVLAELQLLAALVVTEVQDLATQ
jgi:hypothetical protein